MNSADRVDCAVVGDDPATLVFALLLARDGWHVRVLARGARHSTRLGGISPFLSPPSLAVLDRLGLLDALVTAGQPVRQVVEHLADGRSQVLDHDSAAIPYALSVPLRTITEVLHDALAGKPTATVSVETSVTSVSEGEDEVVLGLADGGEVRSRLVVCADGKFSKVRAMAGIGADVVEFGRPLVMAIVPAPVGWPPRIDAHHTGDRELVTTIPLAGDRLIVQWLAAPAVVEQVRAGDVRAWCARLATTVPTLAGWLTAAVTTWDRVLVLRHHVVRPVRWSRGRVALLGDGAHGVHSFAAQGVNLGIQDAVALARALLRDAEDPPAAFAVYERLRRPFVEEFQAYQLAMPQLSGTGAGRSTLYSGLAGVMTHGQPELDVTWIT